MFKDKKELYIKRLEEMFAGSSVAILIQNSCLNATDVAELRRELRANSASLLFVKNTLARIAAEGGSFEFLQDKLCGAVALVFSADITSAAKVVNNFAKNNKKFSILGAGFNSKYLAETEVARIANLPSLPELHAKIITLLRTPAARLSNTIRGPSKELTFLLSAHSNKPNS
ncbi:50S ribosomal protein L10 [Rickettsiales bacterium]|nr:50S ribosomal protein L10 [Rickettsiales bacterium]